MAAPTVEQTDAKSPINETLMVGIRENLGGFTIGDYKIHNSYNGLVGPGPGWMLCDGRIISEANYNTEHGAGQWAIDVGSTALDGKYLPDMDARYPVGKDATAQDGSVAITPVGATGNEVDLAHTHTISHNHQWMNYQADYDTTRDRNRTYDSGGAAVDIPVVTPSACGSAGTYLWHTIPSGGGAGLGGMRQGDNTAQTQPVVNNSYTNNDATVSSSSLSAAQDIRPESIEMQYYLKIV